MEYLEPRKVRIGSEEIGYFNGTLSGTVAAVKFISTDDNFLTLFPTGEFDTVQIDIKKLSVKQQDVIALATQMVNYLLNH